jgi:16S rRNA (guanine527-N7)-methyltransferase
MLDSAQLWRLIGPDAASIVDLGSGAGFPGLVLAIMAGDSGPRVTLVESDQRKCAFLSEVIRQTGANASVVNKRLEQTSMPMVDVVTARALARLPNLIECATPFLKPDGVALFLKGASADEELTEAGKDWTMTAVRHTSLSDPSGTILELRNIQRVIGD